jgi:hypothetical protein
MIAYDIFELSELKYIVRVPLYILLGVITFGGSTGLVQYSKHLFGDSSPNWNSPRVRTNLRKCIWNPKYRNADSDRPSSQEID